MNEMIELDGLSKRFGPLAAVDGITLSVSRGEVLGFLGPNGAGKTTTMRMVAGFIEASGGSVKVCGFDVANQPIEAKRRIGYLPEGAPLYGDMTCAAFLGFVAEMRGFGGKKKRRSVDHAIEMVSLEDVVQQPIDTLSKGFKRRVSLAQAIIHDPDVLILDEPTDGLDPNQKHHARTLIANMARDKAIVVSTHILEEVEAVCTRAVVIDRGRLVADGTSEELLSLLPHHNAVVVRVPVNDAATARAALLELGHIDGVGDGEIHENVATLRVFARHGRSPVADVADRLKSANVTIESLYVERGRLDDVFRALTSEPVSQ
jgi:ABC-2 type transport system ATP-binding protein